MEKPSILPKSAPLIAAIVETGKAPKEYAHAYAVGVLLSMMTPAQREQALAIVKA